MINFIFGVISIFLKGYMVVLWLENPIGVNLSIYHAFILIILIEIITHSDYDIIQFANNKRNLDDSERFIANIVGIIMYGLAIVTNVILGGLNLL